MIKPVSAFSPRAVFRGSDETYGKKSNQKSSSNIAIANAIGVSVAAGGLTTAVARGYTRSWSHASVLGICGALLTMFFMTPHLIEKLGLKKTAQKQQTEVLVKQDTQKVMESAREYLRPAKKLVQFRSEQA